MLADPYPVYQQLRETDPVHWHEPFGAWMLTRYDDVAAAFHDPRLSSERSEPLRQLAGRPELDPFFDYLACRMDFKEPPAHTRLRGLVSKAFTPHVVETLSPHIEALVHQFLDRVAGQGRMDVIRDLAFPLPGTVTGELLGAPAADRAQLKRWSDTFVGFFRTVPSDATFDAYRQSAQAATELGTYFRSVLAGQRGTSRGLLGALEQADTVGDRLSDLELSANATLLLHAGHETTTHLIGNGLLALLRHPGQLHKLQNDPSLLPTAVEEFLRYDSPVQFTYRVAAADFELGNKAIRKGQIVHLMIAAANRDPAHFREPDCLDVTRAPNKHLAFGFGPHFCLGAPLARLEAQIALRTLLQRFPHLRLDGEPQQQENFVLRGLKSFPIALGPQ
jgi:cytochrome P450